MVAKFGPGEGVRYGVATIVLDALGDEVCLRCIKKTLLGSLVWEVEDEEPCADGNGDGDEALDDLAMSTSDLNGSERERTKIHCQPLIPESPSICIRPYARIELKPPTSTETR
jgi:hypothetical protein